MNSQEMDFGTNEIVSRKMPKEADQGSLTSVFENVRENTTSFQPLDAAQVGSGKGKVYSDNASRRRKFRLVFKILTAGQSEINIPLGIPFQPSFCTPLTK